MVGYARRSRLFALHCLNRWLRKFECFVKYVQIVIDSNLLFFDHFSAWPLKISTTRLTYEPNHHFAQSENSVTRREATRTLLQPSAFLSAIKIFCKHTLWNKCRLKYMKMVFILARILLNILRWSSRLTWIPTVWGALTMWLQ